MRSNQENNAGQCYNFYLRKSKTDEKKNIRDRTVNNISDNRFGVGRNDLAITWRMIIFVLLKTGFSLKLIRNREEFFFFF